MNSTMWGISSAACRRSRTRAGSRSATVASVERTGESDPAAQS